MNQCNDRFNRNTVFAAMPSDPGIDHSCLKQQPYMLDSNIRGERNCNNMYYNNHNNNNNNSNNNNPSASYLSSTNYNYDMMQLHNNNNNMNNNIMNTNYMHHSMNEFVPRYGVRNFPLPAAHNHHHNPSVITSNYANIPNLHHEYPLTSSLPASLYDTTGSSSVVGSNFVTNNHHNLLNSRFTRENSLLPESLIMPSSRNHHNHNNGLLCETNNNNAGNIMRSNAVSSHTSVIRETSTLLNHQPSSLIPDVSNCSYIDANTISANTLAASAGSVANSIAAHQQQSTSSVLPSVMSPDINSVYVDTLASVTNINTTTTANINNNNNNNNSFSPMLSNDLNGLHQAKSDSDPFSPSISSNVSSVPSSFELSDKTFCIPSVDSGVVTSGYLSSPFSVPESNRTGECSSASDSFISPSGQRTGSERSIGTPPASNDNSANNEIRSPKVTATATDQKPASPAPVERVSSSESVIKVKEKTSSSHKVRKRKSETKKEKSKHKRQPLIIKPTYQSQISPDQDGIKLKISISTAPPIPIKRRCKSKKFALDYDQPAEQSQWGEVMPKLVLRKIFRMVTETEGCVPFLSRMSMICKLWRDVATEPSLWHSVDLSGRSTSSNPIVNDHNFKWLCENRFTKVQDLNLGGWKFAHIPSILDKMCRSCTELKGITLTGWDGLTAENINFITANCPKLQKIDLSGISSNNPGSYAKSSISTASMLYLTEEIGSRLTHLILSDNRVGGIPQIIASIAANCPNLELLDFSNIRTVAATGHLHIEKLQEGCQKLRVLRITNSQLCLMPTPLKEQMASPGFPLLEELSIACVTNSLMSVCQPFVDDNSIQRILKTSHKLKLLDTRGCSRVTDSSLVRVPAWDLTHLFLSGSCVTRTYESGLELIAQKWSHSLIEVDFAWATSEYSVNAAVHSLAEQGEKSPLKILDLTGSSISLEPVKAVLKRCPLLESLNLSSCRALPRGMKRLYTGECLADLKASFIKSSNEEELLKIKDSS